MNDYPRVKRELIVALDQGRAAALALVETIPPGLPCTKARIGPRAISSFT